MYFMISFRHCQMMTRRVWRITSTAFMLLNDCFFLYIILKHFTFTDAHIKHIRQKNFHCVLYGGKWLSLSLKQIWLMLLDFFGDIFLNLQKTWIFIIFIKELNDINSAIATDKLSGTSKKGLSLPLAFNP